MNLVFTVNEKLEVEVKMVITATCEEIENAKEFLEDLVLEKEELIRDNDLVGKLLVVDSEDEEIYLLEEWDGYDGNSCGVFLKGKTYTLKTIN